MTNRFQNLHRRFGNVRPGSQLIGVEDAAIPVSVLRADVLAQERKELPITDEFTLRFIESGVDVPEDIAAFLGLDPAHVLEAVASQVSANILRRCADGRRVELTAMGTDAVRDAATVRPTFRNLPVKFDRLIWEPADYMENSLIQKKDVDDLGFLRLPAERKARISLDDVTPSQVNALLSRGHLKNLQVLQIHKVSTKKNLYLPVQLLVYADQDRKEIELAVCLDDEVSDAHSLALDRVEIVRNLRMTVGQPAPRPMLDADLEAKREAASWEAHVFKGSDQTDPKEDPSVTSLVRSVSVFEHPDLLAQALTTAATRLLVISPWIRRAVVNTDFLSKIENRLRRGVEVTIAHGYGDDDSGSDADVLQRLTNLSTRFEKFAFVRVKNTHAKILLFDGSWISSSFNWLSFRGDPERTYRMEEGTLVAITSRVDEQYTRYLEMIQEQRRE